MALFGKKESAPEPITFEQADPAPKAQPDGTVIAEGVTFVGNFTSDETIRIAGTVKGDIKSSTLVHIDKTGNHVGRIDTKDLKVEGLAESDVICSSNAAISSTGTMRGDLITKTFESAPGSTFEGALSLNKIAAVPKADVNVKISEAGLDDLFK